MCSFVQHFNIINQAGVSHCEGTQLTSYDQNKWRPVFSTVCTIHWVPDQSDHCSRSKTRALESSATKTRADCKALQLDPILFSDFHNDTRRAAVHTSTPTLFITTQQVSSWQHNSCISDHCLEIQNMGCCWIYLFVQMRVLHDSMNSSSSDVIPISSTFTLRSSLGQ